MATNRVQFQRGLPMSEFLEHYGTEDGCEEALIASRWPQGFACPLCGCFTAAAGAGVHERIVTGGGKASVKLPQFRAVNTVLSTLKTALCGTYHAFDFVKYAPRYLAEA